MTTPFTSMSAARLLAGYADRSFSPVEVMRAALERAHAIQPALNPFVLIDEAAALAAARQSEARWLRGEPAGLVDGIPVAVKDTAAVAGWPTRFGSLSGRSARAAAEDAQLVQRLREHGAAFLGKTAAPEFAWKGLTDSAAHGVTRNPWNAALTPGGSSGGSAVAVATGVVPLATGADGGGSLRIPASFTGTLSVKPTAGLVPNLPTPLGTMAVVGGITRTVADQALLLEVITQADRRDSFAVPFRARGYRADAQAAPAGLRIGFSRGLGLIEPDPEVARVFDESLARLRDAGMTVEPVELDLRGLDEAFKVCWALAFAEIIGRLSAADQAAVEPALQALDAFADTVSGRQLQAAQRAARLFSGQMTALFDRIDLLVTPTVPVLPFPAGQLTPDPARFEHWWDWTPLTWPFNLSRNPAASVPAGFTRDGLPVGVQLIGDLFAESTILRAAAALEALTPAARAALPA